MFLACVLLAISVMVNPHGQTISSVPLVFTVPKALNPQFLAALVTSTPREESGSQQTVSSAQLDISAMVLEHALLSCALLGTSVCQVPTSVQSIHVQRVPLAPGLVPPATLTVSPAQQACIAQHQVFHSPLDFAIQVIIVPREPSAQPLSNTGWNLLAQCCLVMISVLQGISAPMEPRIPCPALLGPSLLPGACRQKSSASPAPLADIAAGQDCLIWLRHRCVMQGTFVWKEALLPVLLMGFMDTDVLVASTVLLALG